MALQNKRYKNALFFLSRALTHHSFTFFNSRFLYLQKRMGRLCKAMCGIFSFIKGYIFVQQEAWTL